MGSVLIIGSTGNVGGSLVNQLAGEGDNIKAATRNPATAEPRNQVEPVRFDYADPATFEPALTGADRVFMIGPPVPEPHTVMLPFLEAATRQPRKIVMMTAMGTELDEGGSLRQVELALERSGSPYVILRPNWFLDNFHTSWLAPIKSDGVIPLPAGDSATSLIAASDIAASAAAALRTSAHDGQGFTLTGPEAITYAEAAAILSEVSGRKIQYVPVDDQSFIQGCIAGGVPADLAEYLAALFDSVREGDAAPVSPAVQQLTGRPPLTCREYAEAHASAWN